MAGGPRRDALGVAQRCDNGIQDSSTPTATNRRPDRGTDPRRGCGKDLGPYRRRGRRIVSDDAHRGLRVRGAPAVQHLVSKDRITVVVDGASNCGQSPIRPVMTYRVSADVINPLPGRLQHQRRLRGFHIWRTSARRPRARRRPRNHDGDADGYLAVDARGQLVDGDQLISSAVSLARPGPVVKGHCSRHGRGKSRPNRRCSRDPVVETCHHRGDYVLEAMLESGYILGGEQAAHVV